MPTTRRPSLTGSDGTPCEVSCTLPASLVFDCFVPGVGLCNCDGDVSAEEVVINDLWPKTGGHGPDGHTHKHHANDDAVLEQAGDVCAVFERILSTESSPMLACSPEDARTLTLIADLALAERKAHESWYALPGGIHRTVFGTQTPGDPDNALAPHRRAMGWFIHQHLVERAQDMATKAARARQQEWEAQQAEHLREARCDARDEVTP